jgi:threonine dehydratase
MKAVIVMPIDAPGIKVSRTRALGAEIVTYDRDRDDRVAIAEKISQERGCAVVASFDDPLVAAGQGTVALEIVAQARARGAEIDYALAASSGGGLVGGLATALKAEMPGAQIYAVEPEGFDDIRRSLKSGKIEKNDRASGSICDALLVQAPSVFTFGVYRRHLAGSVTVSDVEALRAVKVAFETLKLVLEPSGAVGLAAVLGQKLPISGKTVAIVLSGGNVDSALFERALKTN